MSVDGGTKYPSVGGTASAQTPEPYRDPPFECDVYDFARFTDEGGGGGLTMSLPDGFGYEACRAGDGEPEQPTDDGPPADDTDPSGDSSPGLDTAGTARTAALPATGSTNPIAPAIVLAGAALLLRNRWTRRAN